MFGKKFNLRTPRLGRRDFTGMKFGTLTLASIVLTIPFIYYIKKIAESLESIAENRES